MRTTSAMRDEPRNARVNKEHACMRETKESVLDRIFAPDAESGPAYCDVLPLDPQRSFEFYITIRRARRGGGSRVMLRYFELIIF